VPTDPEGLEPAEEKEISEGEEEEYLKDLGRKTLIRLMTGIEEVKELDLEDENKFRETYSQKLNKNTCEALDDLLTRTNCQIDISARWNASKPLDTTGLPVHSVIDVSNYSSRFEKMANYLKKIPEEKTISVKGIIKRLDRDLGNEQNNLLILHSHQLKRNIRVYLDVDRFKMACDAFKDIAYVEITGFLNKKGNYWWLDNPSDFKAQMTMNQS
jgi:hypothetical protein